MNPAIVRVKGTLVKKMLHMYGGDLVIRVNSGEFEPEFIAGDYVGFETIEKHPPQPGDVVLILEDGVASSFRLYDELAGEPALLPICPYSDELAFDAASIAGVALWLQRNDSPVMEEGPAPDLLEAAAPAIHIEAPVPTARL